MMTGSVESATHGAKASVTDAKPSPEALLKQAVSGRKVAKPVPPKADRKPVPTARHARYAAVATGALVVGTAFGMMTAPRPSSNDGLAAITASLGASRTETSRLTGEIETLGRTLASLRESSEAARGESHTLEARIFERVSKLEQNVDRTFTGLTETVERTEREQAARLAGLTAQAEKRTIPQAAASTVTPAAVALPAAKTEPTQTGSITETKPKTETVETWALRDVYNGVAMLEDRKRRLVEVAPGESVPGVGRVESIERRGRAWVVVTKQGVITPQTW